MALLSALMFARNGSTIAPSIMKSLISLFWLATLGASATLAATKEPPVRLSGIVNLPEFQLALIESKPFNRDVVSGLWRIGERSGDFEVRTINAPNGTVEGMLRGSNVVFQINPTSSPAASVPCLKLAHASLDLVLVLYARLSNRSVLRSPVLPAVTVTATSGITNRAEILVLLERQLADQGIVLVPDGEKFVAALLKQEAARFQPAAPPRPAGATKPAVDDIPAGSINFLGAPLSTCVTLYAEFAGKKLDRNSLAGLPDSRVVFYNQTALTRAEVVYAFETLFRLQGIGFEPAADGTLKAVLIPAAKR